MTSPQYDIVTIGGGLGGSAIAKVMAENGARVLVLERETQFRDRVRGESLMWGVADAQALGVLDALRAKCGNDTRFWDFTMGGAPLGARDIVETTPARAPYLTFYHPQMQEALIEVAVEAGADVRRGARVTAVIPGSRPSVRVEENGRSETITPRLVVAADGRTSRVRQWAGFNVRRNPDQLLLAGVLLENTSLPRADTQYMWMDPGIGQEVLLIPIGDGRVRCYVGYHREVSSRRFQSATDLPAVKDAMEQTGAPRDFYANAKVVGPLATFDGADTWVDHPYREGVALVGDAAAASDPSFGQGLSFTVRDVRVLRDQLLATENWDEAGHAYATKHDGYYRPLHDVEQWFIRLMFERGPEADARRARALPLMGEDPTRVPDHIYSGPDLPADETVRRRFFGEDVAPLPA